jgi:DNA primase large subunit
MANDLTRLPFLDAAKEQIQKYDDDISQIAGEDGHTARERAIQRVKSAITNGTNGYEEWNTDHGQISEKNELLSYPLARILISMLGDDIATKRFIDAEATSATQYFEGLSEKSRGDALERDRGLAIQSFIEALRYDDAISYLGLENNTHLYEIDAVTYLEITGGESSDWHIVSQGVTDGIVTVSEDELVDLFRVLIESEVGKNLPHHVPEPIKQEFQVEKAKLSTHIKDIERADTRSISEITVSEFPVEIKDLIEKARDDDLVFGGLEWHTVVMFLASCGASPDEAVDILELDGAIADHVKAKIQTLSGEEGHSFLRAPSFEALEQNNVIQEKNRSHDTPLVEYESRVSQ